MAVSLPASLPALCHFSSFNRLVADRNRPRTQQIVGRHRSHGGEIGRKDVLDRLIALRQDLFSDVALGNLAERYDGGLVVLPIDHWMGAVGKLARSLRSHEHELEHVRN